jgi:hypothetical protein
MRHRGLLLLWAGLAVGAQVLPGFLPRGAAQADPGSTKAPVLAYVIHARLDPATHEVRAQGVLTWRNTTSVPVPDFHLHLYLNAFRDAHSTFLRESHSHRGTDFDAAHPGSIEVTSFRTAAGVDLRPQATYSSCDDANPDDKTVLVLTLPEPIAPGASATFHVDWISRLPKAFARTGFGGDYHMVVQWYPKPGVFEESDQGGVVDADWNCHQFHANSEFFADYGEYDVTITVPAAYKGRVGATGERVDADTKEADGTVSYRHVAKDVHDFAWVCDTDFVVKEHEFKGSPEDVPEELQKKVAMLLGREGPAGVRALDLPRVKVILLLQPEHADQEERHKQAVFNSLRYMGLWFGPYPYSTLTVVDPDHRAADTGGMEYPTLITAGTDYVLHPRGWDPEFVTVHEFGHQYFYGLVGTNEFEHAWMDEGLNTYGTARTLKAAYPPVPPLTWYAGRPLEGEKPLVFEGLLGGLRKALPQVSERLTDDARIPWGKIGFIRSAGEALGLSPPEDLPVLPETPDAGTLAYLREAPFLTLLPIRPISVAEHERTRVARRPIVDAIAGVKAWEYMDGRSYGQNSYARTAASLRTLEALVGEETLLRGLRRYVDTYRYRHPTPRDLFATLTEVAAEADRPALGRLLATLFERADTVDYGVEALDVLDFDDDDHGAHDDKPRDPLAPKRLPESTVLLRRHGDGRLPVEVLVRFEDGSERRVRWELDGSVSAGDKGLPPLQPIAPKGREQGRWTKIRFAHPAKVASAEVDPRHLLNLEHDRTNDGLVREPEGLSPVLPLSVRLLGWVELMTSFYGGL